MKKDIKINLIYKLIHQFLILVFPLIITPYATRILKPTGIGIYSYYSSIVLYFTYIAMFGINIYGNRIISKNRNNKNINKIFSNIYIIQLILSLVMCLLYLIIIIISKYKITSTIFLINIINCIFDINWYYYGREKFKTPIILNTLNRLATLILIFIFVKQEKDLNVFILFKCSQDIVCNFILYLLIINKFKIKTLNKKLIKNNIKKCIVLFIPIIASSIYQQMDKIMLGIIKTKQDVGFYECATKLVVITLGIITSILTIIHPRITYIVNKKESYKQLFNKTINFVMMLSIGIMFGMFSIIKQFVPIFFGKEYINTILLSNILCVTIPIISWSNSLRWLYFIPKEKDKIYLKSVLYGAIINLSLNLFLIVKYSSIGAAIATVISEIIVAIYQTINLKINVKKIYFNILCYILNGIIMLLILIMINNIIIKVILGIIIYILLNSIYLIINKKIINKKLN